ncbi:MAG: calcium-binding protein [Paracoccus sp. BP8]|nr:MAG: calcium-binding protein [Paracoccus sp. BP8]
MPGGAGPVYLAGDRFGDFVMNQTIFLMLGLLGLVGIGSLVSGNDDDHPPEGPADDPRLHGDALIEGDEEDNVLTGTDGDDGILGYDGDDLIDGGSGNDLIGAGYGDDTVLAGSGDDEIYLGSGDDLYGALDLGADEGSDTIDGGLGNDTIITNLGHHSITGGEGDDRIEDHGGSVYIDGEEGDDLILSPDASDPERPDTLLGGEGNDTIHAGAGDIVDGGDGADLIMLRSDAGGAADIAYGGADNITITLAEDYAGDEEYELVQDGDDVRVVLNGEDIAILRDTLARDVRAISLVRETAAT